jgi:hypothetical protein
MTDIWPPRGGHGSAERSHESPRFPRAPTEGHHHGPLAKSRAAAHTLAAKPSPDDIWSVTEHAQVTPPHHSQQDIAHLERQLADARSRVAHETTGADVGGDETDTLASNTAADYRFELRTGLFRPTIGRPSAGLPDTRFAGPAPSSTTFLRGRVAAVQVVVPVRNPPDPAAQSGRRIHEEPWARVSGVPCCRDR